MVIMYSDIAAGLLGGFIPLLSWCVLLISKLVHDIEGKHRKHICHYLLISLL